MMFAGMNSPMPRAVRLLLFTALAALLVHVAHTVFGAGGAPSHKFVDDWLYTLVLAACALMCFARGIGARGERAAWILIGTGIAAWAVGGTMPPSSRCTSCTAAQSPMAQMSL